MILRVVFAVSFYEFCSNIYVLVNYLYGFIIIKNVSSVIVYGSRNRFPTHPCGNICNIPTLL